MKLYRFAGRMELFPNCGLIGIIPLVSANLTELKKFANKWRTQTRKQQLEYVVYIEAIDIKLLDKALIIKVLSEDDSEILIRSTVELKTWKWRRTITNLSSRDQLLLKLPNKEK